MEFDTKEENDNCKCGQESDFGCHGVKNDEVYSEFYCKDCYNKKEYV